MKYLLILSVMIISEFEAVNVFGATHTSSGESESKMKLGPLFGLNDSIGKAQIQGEDASAGQVAGFQAGFELQYSITNSLILSPEIFYIQQNTFVTPVSTTTLADVRFGYIEMPILIKLKFGGEGDLGRPFVFLGPSYSSRIWSDSSLESQGVDFKPAKYDIKAIAGVGLDWSFEGRPVFAQINYSMGFVDQLTDTSNLKFNAIMFTFGTLFSL